MIWRGPWAATAPVWASVSLLGLRGSLETISTLLSHRKAVEKALAVTGPSISSQHLSASLW